MTVGVIRWMRGVVMPALRVVGFGLVLLTLDLGSARARLMDGPPTDGSQVEFFESKIRPVLVAHCLDCHGPRKQKAGLRLDSAHAMREGVGFGPVVVPGDPDQSSFMEAVRYDGDVKMPPDGKLKDAEINALTEWVRRGAVWPASVEPAAGSTARPTPSRDFWAFRPVADSVPPPIQDESWIKSPLDRFILARLEASTLRPSPPADKRTLLRRVTFDLIGLPPTPEEVASFLADETPEAFARVVDRLLASPHYGERWGRHWLDVARYGEDQAHSFQPRLYPNGWRYRDWLIHALNADLPYDRFLSDQIAADLIDGPDRLERLPALGFFALGPVYYGDSKKLDQYDDRIDTLTRGVLGLTVACARCHDHKYDPISQQDYYGLAGIIASTEYKEAPLVAADVVAAYQRGQAVLKQQADAIDAFLASAKGRIIHDRAKETARYLLAARAVADRKVTTKEIASETGLYATLLDRWIEFLKTSPGRPSLRAWEALQRRSDTVCDEEIGAVAEEFGQKVRDLLDRRAQASQASQEEAKALAVEGPDKALIDDLTADKGPLGLAKNGIESQLAAEEKSQLADLRTELDRRKRNAPPMYPFAHALAEGKPSTMKVLARGNADTPGDEAPRRFLDALGGVACDQGSGRLDLARAITSRDNPLTARVMVNRVWHHHFGRGLVGTPGNFGQLGERPSHPELLDWLAARFVESGWSLKALHRLILLSSTYQQAVGRDDRASEIDPENRLHWRANRRRLEVEAWRDALLSVTGLLDPTVGGPSFKLDDPKANRRTVYANVSRHDLAPLLRLFDFPDPNITSASRTQTTVPLQQLIVLNDDLIIHSARALAESLQAAETQDEARIQRAYEHLFARPATASELRIGVDYLAAGDAESSSGLTRWQRYAQALLGTNEFAYLD